MKDFLFVFRSASDARPQASPEQMQATLKRWMDWIGSLAAQNKLTDRGNRLHPEGKVLRPDTVITDGPYTELKETLGGYSIVKADSLEEAVELAKGCPIFSVGGNVEVREINAMTRSSVSMEEKELIPHLFRTEYSKITAVLTRLFGFEHVEIAEDIASDTFLAATELWGLKGLPENPVAWLYTVAKNRARNHLKRQQIFEKKVSRQWKGATATIDDLEIDLSEANIQDSQLQMIFAVCHPAIPAEAQIGLALRILCGFGIGEIAAAFLTNKETINKRLLRAREKLRTEKIKIEFPGSTEMAQRLEPVLRTLYLLFNEGYYSAGQDQTLRKELCLEAMRLAFLLTGNPGTDKSPVNALLALMCFHASRFEARTSPGGETILYDDQDDDLWDRELIAQGEYFLNRAAQGNDITKYHLESAIAYHHSVREDTRQKWDSILQLYDTLLQIEYSPMAALNRIYALSRVRGRAEALVEAQRLPLAGHHLYHVLLGELYSPLDNDRAIASYTTALTLAHSAADKKIIAEKIRNCC